MNGDNASAVRIPPLDGKNYNIWAIKFQNLMIVKGKGDVLDPLEGTTVTASDDRLVKAHMILTADDAHAVDIQAAVSAKAAWDSLAGKYKALTTMITRGASTRLRRSLGKPYFSTSESLLKQTSESLSGRFPTISRASAGVAVSPAGDVAFHQPHAVL